MRRRAIRRVAQILYDHWEEGRDGHTRTFEVIVPDEFVIVGQSAAGGQYREHAVPCATIRAGAKAMYDRRASVDKVAQMIAENLIIVLIRPEEAKRLDRELGLKTTMPEGWVLGEGDPLARLELAGIEVVPLPPLK